MNKDATEQITMGDIVGEPDPKPKKKKASKQTMADLIGEPVENEEVSEESEESETEGWDSDQYVADTDEEADTQIVDGPVVANPNDPSEFNLGVLNHGQRRKLMKHFGMFKTRNQLKNSEGKRSQDEAKNELRKRRTNRKKMRKKN